MEVQEAILIQVIQEKRGGSNAGSNTGSNTGGNTGSGTQTGTGGSSQNKPSSGGNNAGENTTSTNANLKELHLDVEGLTPAFNKNITNYNLVVSDNVNSIQINAIAQDSKAKVSVSGNTNLQTGLNKITIKVIAADNKTTKTYTINATKTDNPNLANANLENLAIENVMLNPEFNENIYEYTAEVGSNIETLNILAVPKIEGATVNIQGQDNINFGENIITISVIAKDGITTNNYQIRLYKKTVEEEQEEIAQINSEQEVVQNDEEMPKKINIGNIVFAIIVVVCIGALIFMLIRKYKNEKV